MNNINLIGRLTKDPELRYTNSNMAYTRFTLAVNRSFSKKDGEKDADFINCVAWDKKAEAISKYVKKGHLLGLNGRIQTSIVKKADDTNLYMTDVVINEMHFLQSKHKDELPAPEYIAKSNNEENEISNDPYKEFGEEIALDSDMLPF